MFSNVAADVRGRNVPRACNECRRRKMKCDGKEPCARCSRRSNKCSYDRQDPSWSRSHATTSVDELRAEINCLRHEVDRMAGRNDRPASDFVASNDSHSTPSDRCNNEEPRNVRPRMMDEADINNIAIAGSPTYRGPTSTEFSFQIAGKNQESRAGSPFGMSRSFDCRRSNMTTGFSSELLADRPQIVLLVLNDPLWIWEPSEIRQLVDDFLRGPGVLYPLVKRLELLKTYEDLLRTLKGVKQAFPESTASADYGLMQSPDAVTLKLVIAISSVMKTCGINRKVQYLFESMRTTFGRSFWGLPSVTGIVNWVLVTILLLELDEQMQASRVISLAARGCLEMGLHRPDVVLKNFSSGEDAAFANNLLKITYILDRRGSMAMGLPFTLQDEEMSSSQATKVDTNREPAYLHYLMSLARVAGAAYGLGVKLSDMKCEVPCGDIDYLDYQIHQWRESLPRELRYDKEQLETYPHSHEHEQDRMLWTSATTLLSAQIRCLVYRPILFSKHRIVSHSVLACRAVEIAQEMLQHCQDLEQHTGVIEGYPIFFKQFLLPAFSILVLAKVNGFDDNGVSNTENVRQPSIDQSLTIAQDIFKALSGRSQTLRRLWTYVQSVLASTSRSQPTWSQVEASTEAAKNAEYSSSGIAQVSYSQPLTSNEVPLNVLQQLMDGPGMLDMDFQFGNELSNLLNSDDLITPMNW